MARILSLVLVLFTASWAAPALAQEYQNADLAKAADSYRQELLDRFEHKRTPNLIPQLRKDADVEFKAKRYTRAIDDLSQAIGSGADDGKVWLNLAEAQYQAGSDRAQASAYLAYTRLTNKADKAEALFVIARDLDHHDAQKDALAVYRIGLALDKPADAVERAAQLERLTAYRVTKVDVQSETDVPSACLQLNANLSIKPDVTYGTYVRVEPAADGIVTGRGDTICVGGLKHGGNYEIKLLTGFPSETGETTKEDFIAHVVVPDRKPSISFAGAGYVLPREGSAGLPVTTINVDKVKLRILKVNERNLVPTVSADKMVMRFGSDDVDDVINRSGSLVWQGEMTIAGERNRAVVTAIPLKDILKDKGPGVYLAVVDPASSKRASEEPATNWILVSNLGLTAYTGRDGMAVAVRSLADAKPIRGVTLRLYAQNNSDLGSATTDADGVARFPGGALHGKGGDAPYAVMAYGPEGDFDFIEVGRSAFDLSDRGVSGRQPPGPVDSFLYTERGIYRPSETVHLMVLARDDHADAATGLPLTLRLLRPDGVEVEHRVLSGGKLGAYALDFPLAKDARIGTWRAELKLDPKSDPIGFVEFRVEDFVPPTLKVALDAPDAPIRPGEDYTANLTATYYYGAPGAGLSAEGNAQIAFDDNPYPDQPGYQFGLVDEKYDGQTQDLDIGATDDDGKASVVLALDKVPDKTKPLSATINVSVFEPSGRAISQTVTRPIRQRDLAIGLHSPFDEDNAVPEGSAATLDLIALDAAGKRIAANGLRWELVRERWQYDWYYSEGSWRYRSTVRDEPIETGTIDIGAGDPAHLSRKVPAGRYRWEIVDGASGAASSLRFHVGWWVEAELPNVPDKLSVTLDKKTFQAGDTAKLFVKAPFAGEAELVIASDHVLSMRSVHLPAEGATLDIPVDGNWGSGVYALVSAYRPAVIGGPEQRGPGRAVGVAWLHLDPAPRTLGVAVTAPEIIRPRAAADFGIKVTGLGGGDEAYVTLAAVDEAVLSLTDYQSPAPQDYFYGKRVLGVELRDIYGRLIDPRAGGVGVLRSGGDQFAKRAVAGLPDKSTRVVSLFSGIVKLDADGAAKIHMDIPDFQGQLRLMAVAFTAKKLGSGVGKTTVRDPVVTTVSLPRFLAPGDQARIGLTINNLEGAGGDYRVKFSATGAGQFTAPVDQMVKLATGQSFNGGFTLGATTIGNVAMTLDLSGPDGVHIVRDFTVGVRPAQSYQLRRFVGQLKPGESVTLDDNAASEFLPGTAEALLSVSPRPEWDVPGLLRQLDRYPYGCIEQTTSRALPLLYVDAVAKLWNADPGFSATAALDGAIARIANMQKSSGAFGVWDDSGDTVPWLNAYATDFLLRAQAHGVKVPDYTVRAALNWLHDYVRREHKDPTEFSAVAYAHYVLAVAKADELPVLRYFFDTELGNLPSRLAQAQLGAALALYGDATRAEAAYNAALGPPTTRDKLLRFVDYGSSLRDNAALLAFAAGDKAMQPRLTAVMDRITELFAHSGETSTQEKAWLLMAAEAAARMSGGSMTVAVNGGAAETDKNPLYRRRALGGGAAAVTVGNKGSSPIWRSVSITGVVKADLPAESKGYHVTREVFHPDGTPADLTKVKQTDLLVVVVTARRDDASRPSQMLLVDLLPAGFEIVNSDATQSSDTRGYPWLKNMTGSGFFSEARDDRYIASMTLDRGTGTFAAAYVVRAVTPGEYKYPALDVEDMYDPETLGRSAVGKLVVSAK